MIDKPDNNNNIINDRYKSRNRKGKMTLKTANELTKNAIGNA
jgi:hypothetical protein